MENLEEKHDQTKEAYRVTTNRMGGRDKMSLEESAVFATQLTRIMVFMYLDRRERAPSMKQGEMVIKRIRKNFKTILGYNPTTLKHMRQYLKWKI